MRAPIQGLILAILLIALILAGCVASPPESVALVANPKVPIEIVDQVGRTVRLAKIPRTIVSLAPSNTEMVYALGLEDRLLGVTEFCDYPEAALSKPRVGSFSTVNVEKVVEIQPDLILAVGKHQDNVVPELERLGFTTLILAPKTIDEVMAAISLVGQAAGEAERAARLVGEMQTRVKAVTDTTANLAESRRPRVLFLLWADPLMTVGPGAVISELIEKAGGINISGDLDDDYPKISLEAVIIADPQVIIAGGGHGDGDNIPFDYTLSESRLEGVAARLNGRVYRIDADLTNRPGPRIIDGLEEMARLLQPGLNGTAGK